MRVSWLNLHQWIPQKDVRKIIYRKLDYLDREVVLNAHGCKFFRPALITEWIACRGYLNLLKWWISSKYFESVPYQISVVPLDAAKNGHLHILKWLDSIERLHDKDNICRYAADGGHLVVLKWAIEKGFKIGRAAVNYAAFNGHLHILKWLYYVHGYNFDLHECRRYALPRKQQLVLDWIQGLPDGI